MGNWAATSFLKPSSLRFGVSEGFSEDWGVNFQDHCDSCIGPGELGSTLCPLHFTDDPAGNKAFKSKHTEIWQSWSTSKKMANSSQIRVPAFTQASCCWLLGVCAPARARGMGSMGHQGELGTTALPKHRSPRSRGWGTPCPQRPPRNWPLFYCPALPLSCLPPSIHMVSSRFNFFPPMFTPKLGQLFYPWVGWLLSM